MIIILNKFDFRAVSISPWAEKGFIDKLINASVANSYDSLVSIVLMLLCKAKAII
jgi:hypothetical protein